MYETVSASQPAGFGAGPEMPATPPTPTHIDHLALSIVARGGEA